MLGLKLIHVGKGVPGSESTNSIYDKVIISKLNPAITKTFCQLSDLGVPLTNMNFG